MVYLTLINFTIIISIFGYSYLIKRILYRNDDNYLKNIDLFFGLFFLLLISLIINFFFPLNQLSKFVIFFGILLFIICIFKKKSEISLIKYFFTIFIFSTIAYYGTDNIDSPLYHLQVIKWLTEHKITFGLANLGFRLGVNYPWFSIIGVLNIDYNLFSNKYYLSLIIFSFILYEILNQKKINKALIFLSLCFSYIFLFSLIHPFKHGVILNHFGNPEKDIFNMLLFIINIYIFLNINENQNENEKQNFIAIFFISLTLLFMQMPIYISAFPIILFILFKHFKFKDHKYLLILIFTISTIWILRSVIINGCLVYPASFTCLNTKWTVDLSQISLMIEEVKKISRSLPSLELINNTYVTLDTYLWIKPWFKNYFLTMALHQINLVLILSSLLIIIFLFVRKKIKFRNYDFYIIISVLLVNIVCTLQMPEIRYYWGPHISLSCFFVSLLMYSNKNKIIQNKNIYKYFSITILGLFLIFKVVPFIKLENFLNLPGRNFTVNKIKLGNFDGYNVYTTDWYCADISEICVNSPKKNYSFDNKYNYLIINK